MIGHHDGRFSLAGRRACRRANKERKTKTKNEEGGGVSQVGGARPKKVGADATVVPLMEMEWKPMRNMM